MAINLSCYTTKESNEILEINQKIAECEILFTENRFLLYSTDSVNQIELEIAEEFDFFLKMYF